MKRILLFFFVFFIFSQSIVLSQVDPIFQKIVEIGKEDNQTMRHQDFLCNIFGGRLTGSDAYTNSAQWVLNELKSWGLNAELDEVGEVPVGYNRGPWFGKMLKPNELHLQFATPSYTAGTKGRQQGKVVIVSSSYTSIDSIKTKAKNAWVLIDGVNEGWPRDRDSVSNFVKILIEAGALGTIQKSPIPMRVLDLRTVNSWDQLPKLPDIKLVDKQYDEIKSLVEQNEEVILEFDIRNFFKPGPVKYHNVIGWIPGTEKPEEYVILGAHLDSYDIGTGAVDNASGVTRMMEAVRLLSAAGAKPKRTIMVQLYAAEERGLVGSRSWVDRNKDKLPNISIMLNNDSGTNPIVSMLVPKVIYDVLKPIVEPIEKIELPYPFELKEMQMFRRAGRGGTDSHSFNMAGVPAPWLRTQGPHSYTTTWHTPLDTYNEIIPDAQEHSALVIALLAYQIANMDQILPREGAFLPDGIFADLNTNKGRITLNIDYKNVPMTSANFIGLTEGTIKNESVAEGKPFYNGSVWHRVVPGHVIQAGKPNSPNQDVEGPGYEFPNEIFSGLIHNKAGMLGMANAGPHTNGSQFYITLADRSYLDGNYTLFGSVIEGMDIVDKIEQGDTIKSVAIMRIGEEASKFKTDTETFFKMVEKAKQKVKMEKLENSKKENEWINNNIPDAIETESGVRYKILNEGNKNISENDISIKVIYKGKVLLQDLEFFSTSEGGLPNDLEIAEPFDYQIEKSKINDGLDEMIKQMKIGEKRIVIVPSEKGYGTTGFYGKSIDGKKRFVISPNSTLVYEIEILGTN